MLMIHPRAPYGNVGAVLSALIVTACLIGLTLHADVYAKVPRKGFFTYYTNLSNMLVLLYFTWISPFLYARSALRPLIPYAEFYVTSSIMLTNAVFHFVIFPAVRPQLKVAAPSMANHMLTVNNLFVHYIVPWLVLAYYLLCSPSKDALSLAAAPLWIAFPLIYVSIIFLRARTKRDIAGQGQRYPYPFLDIDLLGKRLVYLTCLFLFALCVLSSIASVCLIRSLYALLGGEKTLFLVG